MNARWIFCFVDEPDDRFSSSCHHKGWARGRGIVPNEARLVALVYLGFEGSNVNLVVI